MSLLSVDELKALIAQPQETCVSIYMPTYQGGLEAQQNPIRFKNLIRQAEAQLQAYGLNQREVTELLQPAMNLDQESFWQHQNEGLVLFASRNFFRYFCLPLSFQELVVVGDRLHLKPIMSLLAGDGKFYILTLNQEQVRFFEASRYDIQEVQVEGMPTSKEAALQYDETAKDGQFRINTSKGGTNNPFTRSGSYHGQGSPDRDKNQRDILQFFHLLNSSLHPILHDQRALLVLAGVDSLLPLYRAANTYPHLLEESLTENVNLLKPEELHPLAWQLVEPYFHQAQADAVQRYHELQAAGKTSSDVKEVVPAACYGRVEELFVAIGVQHWGNFDPTSNVLEVHDDTQPGDQDLLNLAAIQTLANGGTVYAVNPDQVPDESPVAAVFRY